MSVKRPKIRLLSVLLIVAIAALAFAWNTERTRAQRERMKLEDRLEGALVGSHQCGEVTMLLRLADSCKDLSGDSEYAKELKEQLVLSVHGLWRNQKDIDSAVGEPIAAVQVKKILETLKILLKNSRKATRTLQPSPTCYSIACSLEGSNVVQS